MTTTSPLILLGVGTAGARIAHGVQRAFDEPMRLTLVDTDATTGEGAESFVLLGGNRLAGQGSGGNIVNARMAADDSVHNLDPVLEGVRLAVIVTSLGGGTGGGATTEILKHLSSRGIPAIVFATLPFLFEGDDRQRLSRGVMPLIEEAANATFFIPLDKLVTNVDQMDAAIKRATEILASGITLFWRLIEKPGYLKLDQVRVRRLIQSAGRARFATVTVQGINRAQEAVDRLVNSELLATSQAPVKSILCGVLAGEDLRLSELDVIASGIRKTFGEQLAFDLGTVNDETVFSGRISVVIMLFEETASTTKTEAPSHSPHGKTNSRNDKPGSALGYGSQGRFFNSERTEWHGEDLDIPTYLRQNITLDF